MVAAGEWRDYAIDHLKDKAVFSIFRRTTEMPLFRVEKDPALTRRQGTYSVIAAGGYIMKRGHDLRLVLNVLEPHLAAVNDAAWWLVAVCGAAALFFLISAVSLLRNTRQAFVPYLAAFVATAVLWWFVCQAPKHGLDFAVAGREREIGFLAGLVVLGLLVALTDRRKRYRPDAD